MNDEEVKNISKAWVRKEKKNIISKIAGNAQIVDEDTRAHSIFMAGSPGAGKTEFSRYVTRALNDRRQQFVRIDADEIRSLIPTYTGKNSYLLQPACTLAVEKVHDYVLHKKMNFILDTTLGSYAKAQDNIKRSLDKKRLCEIIYIYQDPIKSWELTKAREIKEGRNIPKTAFINELFAANLNVKMLKSEFGDDLLLDIIVRDYENSVFTTKFEIGPDEIDKLVKINYSPEELVSKLES